MAITITGMAFMAVRKWVKITLWSTFVAKRLEIITTIFSVLQLGNVWNMNDVDNDIKMIMKSELTRFLSANTITGKSITGIINRYQ